MNMLGYSTLGFADRDAAAALDAIAEAGFEAAEILCKPPHLAEPLTGSQAAEFRAALERRKLHSWTVHAPLGRTVLGAPQEPWRCEKVAELARFIRFSGEIAARAIIIHPVPNPMFVPDADDPQIPALMRSALSRSLDDLLPLAEQTGVRILLENLPYHCGYPFLSMRDLRALVERYPASCLGLVVDTGHVCALRNDLAGEIHAAGPRLCGTHLSDFDSASPADGHRVPGRGELDWQVVRSALADLQYTGPLLFEIGLSNGQCAEDVARATLKFARSWAR